MAAQTKPNEKLIIGEKVRITGLKKQTQYNQHIGSIIGPFDDATKRYPVQLPDKTIKIKNINIKQIKNERCDAIWLKPLEFKTELELLNILEPIRIDSYQWWNKFGWGLSPDGTSYPWNGNPPSPQLWMWYDTFFLRTQSVVNLAGTYFYGSMDPYYRVLGDCVVVDGGCPGDCMSSCDHRITLEQVANAILKGKKRNKYIKT
eukprot:327530_1